MELNTKNYLVFLVFPIGKDLDEDKWGFNHPRFKFRVWNGKPCVTRWIYDWALDIGYLSIWRKAIDLKKVSTPDCVCKWGRGYREQWKHTSDCPMSKPDYDYEARTKHLRPA